MTRRLLAAISLAALAAGGAFSAAPASAAEDSLICIGGQNERQQGYTAICVLDLGESLVP